jgi:hypothetical protein
VSPDWGSADVRIEFENGWPKVIVTGQRKFFPLSELELFAQCKHHDRGILDQVLKRPGGAYVWLTVTTDEPLNPSAITRGWNQATLVDEVEVLRPGTYDCGTDQIRCAFRRMPLGTEGIVRKDRLGVRRNRLVVTNGSVA